MSFFQELWRSIFEPGTTPQLLIATHLSFASLVLVLAWLCYATRNVHFYALLTIASILWGLVTWFVNELQQSNLKNNDDLARAQAPAQAQSQRSPQEPAQQEPKPKQAHASGASASSRRTRSRKT